jgi:DtxR family transcriptional regulator, Mn-dependent transcriptional regulator
MATSTVENYVKQLYLLGQERPEQTVPMGALARAMGVVPGTATTMVKALARAGWARHLPRVGARLTPEGKRLALHMLRKHRLIEMFLVHTLRLDWSEIHAEAELLEHALSDRLVDRLDAFLGHPRADPHGDPIPSAGGRMAARAASPLTELPNGAAARIGRILRQDPEFLRFLHGAGLHPGRTVRVLRRDSVADLLELALGGGGTLSLGSKAAAQILVERTGARPKRARPRPRKSS